MSLNIKDVLSGDVIMAQYLEMDKDQLHTGVIFYFDTRISTLTAYLHRTCGCKPELIFEMISEKVQNLKEKNNQIYIEVTDYGSDQSPNVVSIEPASQTPKIDVHDLIATYNETGEVQNKLFLEVQPSEVVDKENPKTWIYRKWSHKEDEKCELRIGTLKGPRFFVEAVQKENDYVTSSAIKKVEDGVSLLRQEFISSVDRYKKELVITYQTKEEEVKIALFTVNFNESGVILVINQDDKV